MFVHSEMQEIGHPLVFLFFFPKHLYLKSIHIIIKRMNNHWNKNSKNLQNTLLLVFCFYNNEVICTSINCAVQISIHVYQFDTGRWLWYVAWSSEKIYNDLKTLIKFDCKSNEHFRRISSVRPHQGSTSKFPWYSWTASWCHHSCYHLVLQPCGPAWIRNSLGRQRIRWRRDRPLSSEIRKAWTGERSQLAWPAANCFLENKIILVITWTCMCWKNFTHGLNTNISVWLIILLLNRSFL